MATRREETQPYSGGAGGKILKRPFRSTHATPYDRPPTAFRNPNGGWISKLVDPAQRLIASGASRIFSTVFRRHLPPPQPLLATGSCLEARNAQQEAVTTDTFGKREGASHQNQGSSNSDNRDSLTELEQILTQKTFTRSEIERLAALLHSKTADISNENHDKRPDLIDLRPVASPDKQGGLPGAPAQENGIEIHHISTPLVTSSVLDEDITSPAELAKAYMGSKPLKVSPSMLGSRSLLFRESSTVLNSVQLPSKLPIIPLLPRTSGNLKAPENGVITPRSRGRSAICSMARTPYSRIQSTSTFKGVGSPIDANGGSSSSQSVLEQSSFSGSKQGALERRSSVLDNDIGLFGPIRRIRQKPNLLSSRGLGSHTSGMPISISGIGLGPHNAQSPSFSVSKRVSFGEAKHDFMKASTKDGDNAPSSSSFPSVPSKSSEMASKILQQLDKLISPKEKSSESKLLALRDKSPSKLSPSMLHGQALKSLEDVDSSKFFANIQDKNISDGSTDKLVTIAGDVTSQKQNKAKENGSLKLVAPSDKSADEVNGIDSIALKKDATTSVRTAVHVASSTVSYPQRQWGFRMSAHEDFLELDDEGFSNGAPSDLLADVQEKSETFLVERKNDVLEPVLLEQPSALDKVKPVVPSTMNQKTDLGTSDGSVPAEKRADVISPSTFLNMAIPSTIVTTQSSLPTLAASQPLTSDEATKAKESNVVTPIFNFGDEVASAKDSALSKESNFALGVKVASTKGSNDASPLFNFGLKNLDEAPQVQLPSAFSPSFATESAGIKCGDFSEAKPETKSSSLTAAAGISDSQPKVPELDKTDDKKNVDAGGSSTASEAALAPAVPASTPKSIFSFVQPSNSSDLNNGSFASTFKASVVSDNLTQNVTTSSFTSSGNDISATSSTMVNFNSGSISLSTPAASIFKFGSSAPTTGVSISTPDEIKTKQDSSVGNSSSTPFSGTSAPVASTGSSLFGFSASATSTIENRSQVSTSFGAGSGSMLGAQAMSARTSVTSFSQSIPIQFGSTLSSPSFGVAGNTTFSTGSGSMLGTQASPAATGVASFTQTTPIQFGSTPSSPSFGVAGNTTFSTGSGSMLGAQVSPAATGVASFTQSTPIQFGSSSSSPVFGVAGNTTFSTGSSLFGSTSASKLFGSGAITGQSSSSSEAVSSSSGTTPSLSNWPSAKSPIFGSTFNSTSPSPSTGFSFGGSTTSSATAFSFGGSTASAITTSSASMVFGSSNGASSNSIFSFTSSSASAPTQPVFGSASPAFNFGSASAGNNDQMNMEDSMAEDTVQASTPTISVFGQQQPVLPSPSTVQTAASTVPAFGQQPLSQSPTSFAFGSTGSSAGAPFQFGGQPNLTMPQNPSPFQASGSLGFTEGSNFSLGSGGSGVDKSNRKYVKPVRNKHRKK